MLFLVALLTNVCDRIGTSFFESEHKSINSGLCPFWSQDSWIVFIPQLFLISKWLFTLFYNIKSIVSAGFCQAFIKGCQSPLTKAGIWGLIVPLACRTPWRQTLGWRSLKCHLAAVNLKRLCGRLIWFVERALMLANITYMLNHLTFITRIPKSDL